TSPQPCSSSVDSPAIMFAKSLSRVSAGDTDCPDLIKTIFCTTATDTPRPAHSVKMSLPHRIRWTSTRRCTN
ncbi:hypothetical protein BGZ88_005576, partial [Linnemannia elongata]